jgi:hypothetical protein
MLAVLAVIVGAVGVPRAQQGTADLRGRVLDAQQGALPGVTVVARNPQSGVFRETTSGADGSFFLGAMNPGTYQVEVMLAGFRPYLRSDVRLEVGRATGLDVVLELGGLAETVTVTGEAPLVDTASKEVGGNVSATEFIDTPVVNRSFAGFLGMVPGVVATVNTGTFGGDTISVGGQGSRNVVYTMDGSDNNDGLTGGGTSSQARMPVEAVAEFKVITSQFDAEYGNTSGAIVNAVSKSGTNLFRGSGFAFYQDQNLSRQTFFARQANLPRAPTTQQQYGGTIGGPIIQNRAHFFFSVERILFDQGVVVNIPTRPDLNRTDFGVARNWNTFVRLDHQLNAGNSWGVRWLREDSPQPILMQPTYTRDRMSAENDLDQTWVGTLSSVIGSTKVNTLRVSRTSEELYSGSPAWQSNGNNQKVRPPTLVYQSFQAQESPNGSIRLLYGYGLDNTFSWFVPNRAGSHELKFGVSYNYVPLEFTDTGTENGQFTFSHDLPFNAADPRTYPERLQIRVPGSLNYSMHGTYLGGFAQDRWTMANRLTVSVGARYDVEIIPTPNVGNPMFANAGDKKHPLDLNNVSPRLGVSLALDDQGRSAMRGGVGLFYQRTVLQPLTPLVANGPFSDSFIALFPTNTFDPGPRNGQLPTNPLLANGPVINRALVDSMFPPGSTQRNAGTVRFDNPDRVVPWTRQYSIGYSTQLGTLFAVGVDYVRSDSRDQFVLKDLNPALRATGLATGAVTRTNPLLPGVGAFVNRVETLLNEGSANFDSLQFTANKRLSQGYTLRMSYAYQRARGNTTAGSEGAVVNQYLDDLRLDREWGPTATDRPHVFSMTGSWDVPHTGGLRLSGFLSARSGTPYTLINSTFDADRNGFTDNEYLAAGTYSGTGRNALTVENKGGRNGARGPGYASLDLRMGYRLSMARERTLDLFLDVFNITDRVNLANPAGDQRVTGTFLVPTNVVGATRTAQLNVRYGF